MTHIDLSQIFNWPGITLFVSVVSGVWYLIKQEIHHKRTARFDIAINRIYIELEKFILAANKVHTNINTLPIQYVLEKKSDLLDEWITHPIYHMENVILLTEMFFSEQDRRCFNEILEAARNYKFELHKAFSSMERMERMNICERARVAFNKSYQSNMEALVQMVHEKLLGGWEYDLTKLKLRKDPRKQAKRKRNQ